MRRVLFRSRSVTTILMTFLLNFLHLGVWFVCLWLLLRFQWSHALGLAIVFCLAMTLVVLPMLFTRTERAAIMGCCSGGILS